MNKFDVEVRPESPSNTLLCHVKQMHLVCFALLFVANVFPSGSRNGVLLNWRLVKALMSFITIPYYIYQICNAFDTLDQQFITFSYGSTPENYTVEETLYLSQKYGNALLWIRLEIFAFYCNLLVCCLYLAKARCTSTEDTTGEDFGYMVVCQDYSTEEEHNTAANVQFFNLKGA